MPLAPLSANDLLHPDPTSERGARFVVERPLSAGGFAITYLARDQQFDDRCVIKELAIDQLMVRSGATMVPLPGREEDVAIWVQKVQKEAQVLHRLRSSGVVPVRATWRENGTAYFAMDFIDGIELPDEPTPGANWATWEPVATKFLAALGAIHATGLVHGDIKPQNVLVNREGNPVIIDFGTARSVEASKKTKLTTIAMTPGYCPPELAVRDRAREMGPWSDLYSWALTVMGLVVRHRGIDGAPLDTSARVALQQHGHKEAGIGDETARALRAAGLPEGWVDALMACVALEPSARPQSTEEVAECINAAPVERASPVERPASRRYRARNTQPASALIAAAKTTSEAITSLPASPLLAAPADNSTNRAALLVEGSLIGAVALIFVLIGDRQNPASDESLGSGASAYEPHLAGSGPETSGYGSGLDHDLANTELSKAFDRLSDNSQLQAIFQNNGQMADIGEEKFAKPVEGDGMVVGRGSGGMSMNGNGRGGGGFSAGRVHGVGKLDIVDDNGRGRRGAKGPTAAISSRARVPTGFLAAEQIEKVVRRHKAAIKECYEREIVNDANLGGRIGVQWTVGLDGKVVTASVSENTMGNKIVESCILAEVQKMRFDHPDGGMVVVAYPFTFRRAEE